MSPRVKGALCLVASAFGFALMAFFVRLTDEVAAPISTFQKAFFRNLIALAIAAVVFFRTPASHRNLRVPLPLLLRSLFGTIGIFANFFALSRITIAEGQTLNKTAPFFTLLFAWLFLRERPTPRQFLTLALAFLGVILIAKPGFAGDSV